MSNDSEVLNEYSAWRLALYEQPEVVDDSVQRFLGEREDELLARRARAALMFIFNTGPGAEGNEPYLLENVRRILEGEPGL